MFDNEVFLINMRFSNIKPLEKRKIRETKIKHSDLPQVCDSIRPGHKPLDYHCPTTFHVIEPKVDVTLEEDTIIRKYHITYDFCQELYEDIFYL